MNLEGFIGSDFADEINGSELSEGIDGRGGDDVIRGLGGADGLGGGEGHDLLDGGAGDDGLYGDYESDPGGNDVLWGRAGKDTLEGGVGNDLIQGGADADYLYGDRGNDRLGGGKGNDRIGGGKGSDFFQGDVGNDVLDGGPIPGSGDSQDTVSYHLWFTGKGAYNAVVVDLRAGTASGKAGTDSLIGITAVEGTKYGDRLIGVSSTLRLMGKQGNDRIRVFTGHNQEVLVSGDRGDDTIEFLGGWVLATIAAGAGRNAVHGTEAADVLLLRRVGRAASEGMDTVHGHGGRDRIRLIDQVLRNDRVFGGGDRDTCRADKGDLQESCEG